jgi:hypothetical protein
MTQIPLREPLIMRLGEGLRRQDLVGDLGVGPDLVGVVDARAVRRPDQECRLARSAASRSSLNRKSSGFGSTTTTPNPFLIAACAISAIVTVFPDPVAPATSVIPDRDPQTGIRTAAPLRSWPTTTPASVAHRPFLIRRRTTRELERRQ